MNKFIYLSIYLSVAVGSSFVEACAPRPTGPIDEHVLETIKIRALTKPFDLKKHDDALAFINLAKMLSMGYDLPTIVRFVVDGEIVIAGINDLKKSR